MTKEKKQSLISHAYHRVWLGRYLDQVRQDVKMSQSLIQTAMASYVRCENSISLYACIFVSFKPIPLKEKKKSTKAELKFDF